MSGDSTEDALGPRCGYGELHVVGSLLRQAFQRLGGVGPRNCWVRRLVGNSPLARNDLSAMRRSVLVDEVDHYVRVRRQGQSSSSAGEAVEGEGAGLQLERCGFASSIPFQKLVLA